MNSNYLLIILIVFVLIACEKQEQDQVSISINFESSFPTEVMPKAIAVDEESGFVFVANYAPIIKSWSSKIQKFDLDGTLIETIIDLDSTSSGELKRYIIKDMCINLGSIFALVRPLYYNGEFWDLQYSKIYILMFDYYGDLLKEYNIDTDIIYNKNMLACSNDFIYVYDGESIMKISKESGMTIEHDIPNLQNKSNLLISDIEVDLNESLYATGVDVEYAKTDSIFPACYISNLSLENENQNIVYSKSKIGIVAAEPNNPGISINNRGIIYLATYYAGTIEIFDDDYRFILQETIRSDDGKTTNPIDVALGNGRIYLLDSKNNHVYVYRENYD